MTKADFVSLLEELKNDYHVCVPCKKGGQRVYKKLNGGAEDTANILVGEVRSSIPLKSFYSRAREKVADGFGPGIPHANDKPYCIVGVKACDLKGFKIQDFVFSGQEPADPLYGKMRKDNLVISSDCTCAIDTCFCLALEVKPYPQENFDLNLSPMPDGSRDGYLVESGSRKGNELLERHRRFFGEAPKDMVALRDERRARVVKEVEENIRKNNIPHQNTYKGIIKKKFDSNIWADEAKTCVECGACNTICPTCHCFLLCDQAEGGRMQRVRVWDSCMVKDFARVAGGGNPRPKLWMRLRNRYEKKFDFFPDVAKIYACTGCGRCISCCPAKIDIRRVLRNLVNA